MLGVPLVGTLAVIGIIYGALCSLAQQDIKKLVAYSSVSHLGFCMLGMFALNAEGISGSVLQMVNHGLSTGALFLLVGMLYDRYHTRMMTDLGGLAVAVALAGLRHGLHLSVQRRSAGAERLCRRIAVADRHVQVPRGLRGVRGDGNHPRRLVSADHAPAFVLRAVEGAGHARRDGPRLELPRTGRAVPLAALCLWIGVYPKPVLDVIRPDVQAVARIYEKQTGRPQVEPRYRRG